jgi:hypothetical protein
MYLTTFTTDENQNISALSSIKCPTLVEVTFDAEGDTQHLAVEYEGINYEADITLHTFNDIISDIKPMTNGEL